MLPDDEDDEGKELDMVAIPVHRDFRREGQRQSKRRGED